MFEQARCWMDGEILPASAAKVSVFDHGFLYGDGVFEGVRFYNNKAFRLPLLKLLIFAHVPQRSPCS